MVTPGYEAPMLAVLLAISDRVVAASPAEADSRLMARARTGDRGALKALYERHAGRAMAIATRILRNPAEAEEVVQDTFVEVWRRAPEYDAARGGVGTWIATIARSRSIDRLRARGSSERTALAAAAEPVAESRGALEAVEQRAARERISTALAELPIEQRSAIELAYFEGLTQREIAERTGDPLGTIKSRIRLAMQRLADLLGGES